MPSYSIAMVHQDFVKKQLKSKLKNHMIMRAKKAQGHLEKPWRKANSKSHQLIHFLGKISPITLPKTNLFRNELRLQFNHGFIFTGNANFFW